MVGEVAEQPLRVTVRVSPRSSQNRVAWEANPSGGTEVRLRAWLTAPPVEGAANEALIKLLSEQLRIPRRQIRIIHGANGRQKIIEITGLTLTEVRLRLV